MGKAPSVEELRHDIAGTQHEMSETVHEIEHRLSPRYLMQQTKSSVRRAGVSTSHRFIDKVKENPIPAAMVGMGLWLFLRNSDDEAPRYNRDEPRDFETSVYEEPSNVERAKERAADVVENARDKASHLADTMKEKASQLADTTKEKVSDVAESTRETAAHFAQSARTQAYATGSAAPSFR
jgi:vacuolar-type H+-ATPase subunit H